MSDQGIDQGLFNKGILELIEKQQKFRCEKHGEHDNYVEFDGEPFAETAQGVKWCLRDIAEQLIKTGERMELISDPQEDSP